MKIERLQADFSICKLKNLLMVNFEDEFLFLSKTDEELSLVCKTDCVPLETIECEHGWKAFRIQGVLDFSLVGILSKISSILAENDVGLFAVSTFNTDYILVKENQFNSALTALEKSGYTVL